MEIELSQLTAVGIPVQGKIRLGESGPGGLAADAARFPEPLDVVGHARRVGDLVLVSAHVAGKAILQCGRCLALVEEPLNLDFEARYAPHSAVPKVSGTKGQGAKGHDLPAHGNITDAALAEEVGIQLGADELDISFLPAGARTLLLEDVVREQVLLELPLRAICKRDCLGLCARCGDDLNAGACRCGGKSDPGDLRFAALAEIKKRLEKN